MYKLYHVALTDEEREQLKDIIKKGKSAARVQIHAHILLKAERAPHGPGWTDEYICGAFDVSRSTVERVRRTLVEHGLDAALHRRAPSRSKPRKLDGEQEARLIAIAGSPPPEGKQNWTLRMLRDKLVELEIVESVGIETVRQTLKKTIPSCSKRSPSAFPLKRTQRS